MKKLYKNQIGRFMIEMLVVLALLGLFTPMIYRAQTEKKQREANVTNAGQINQIVDSVATYIERNLSVLTSPTGETFGSITFADIDDAFTSDINLIPLNDHELLKFLPDGLSDINTNRLFKEYMIGLRRDKIAGGTDVSVSAMVLAIPKKQMSNTQIADISSMLGAAGGSIQNIGGILTIVGNNDIWELTPDVFFNPTDMADITVGTIAANVDYYTTKQPTEATGTVDEDLGFIHRTGEGVEADGSANEMTTMEVDLEMGEGPLDTQKRFGFTNVEGVYSDNKENTCDPDSENCIKSEFKSNMAGKTELGLECQETDSCISVNGAVNHKTYQLRPSDVSTLEDIRLGADNAVQLRELIPPLILLEVHRNLSVTDIDGSSETTPYEFEMENENCPTGYIPTTAVVPVSWEVETETVEDDTNTSWPFFAMNFKNNVDNDGNSVFLWGSGKKCADLKFSDDNILAIYLDKNNVEDVGMRSVLGDVAQAIGGSRPEGENASFSITASTDTTFVDTEFDDAECSTGKLEIDLASFDRCGISNISTAFACNEELFTQVTRDFHANQNSNLLRWEFYHPPEELNNPYGGIDLYAYTTPISEITVNPVTFPDGSTDKIMQTRKWLLHANSSKVQYDVYVYCKYTPQAFE